MQTWIEHLAPLSNHTSVFDCLGNMYAATGRMQNPPVKGGTTEQGGKDIYATNSIFFNMISQTLMTLPNVHMYTFNESAAYYPGGFLCSNPLGAHACETPFVISDVAKFNMSNGIDNIMGGEPMDTVVQRNMRKVWANYATSGNPGWAHDEVGVFQEDEIKIRTDGAVFDPSIKNMLNKLMCHPASISSTCELPHTYTCGEVKRLFRNNVCCGNPNKPFNFH